MGRDIDMRNPITVAELTAPHELRFVDTVLRDELQEHEIYAETICSAISPGTETAAYLGSKPLRPGNGYPRVVGYCNVAKIKHVGKNVKDYRFRDIILTGQSHRTAFVCNEGSIYLKIPNGYDLHKAATTFLYHLGYEALKRGTFGGDQNVAIIGLGTLGTITVDVANCMGVNVFSFSNRFKSDIPKVPIDLVITTSNTWADWLLALNIVKNEGTIGVLGFPGRGQAMPDFNPLEPQYLYAKNLTIVYCGHTPDSRVRLSCEWLLALIQNGKLHPGKIISNVYPWRRLEEAYKNLIAKRDPYTAILTYEDV